MARAMTGGAALEKRLADFAKRTAGGPVLRVGFLENARYPNGTLVAAVAAIQEFGAPRARIPPRPFFRTMIAKHKAEWPGVLKVLMQAHGDDAVVALTLLGQLIEGELRQSIVDTMAPPLSPITLMLRWMKWKNPDLTITGAVVGEAARRVDAGKSSAGVSVKPLVDSGHLLNSIDSEVVL